MGGGGGTQETKTEISPEFKPYITYSLGEAQRLYKAMPGAPETLAVSPSAATQQALQMAQQRAVGGSPLLKAAQEEQLATIQGRGVNPFLGGALGVKAVFENKKFGKQVVRYWNNFGPYLDDLAN